MNNSQWNKGLIEFCVMALVRQKDRYGYELIEIISDIMVISEGSVYPILRRLTKDSYFETYLVESTSGPPRKYYKITPAGVKKFDEMKMNWDLLIDKVNQVLNNKI